MEWQNSSSIVGQQLRCLLEKFSKKYLADQTRKERYPDHQQNGTKY